MRKSKSNPLPKQVQCSSCAHDPVGARCARPQTAPPRDAWRARAALPYDNHIGWMGFAGFEKRKKATSILPVQMAKGMQAGMQAAIFKKTIWI
jgi:hypothetical protein